jgi:Flp pilus assembly protein TadD
LLAKAMAVFNSGDKKKGLEYLFDVAPLYPNDSGVLAQLATAYVSLADIENAKLLAEKAVATKPDDVYAWAVLKKIQALEITKNEGTTS